MLFVLVILPVFCLRRLFSSVYSSMTRGSLARRPPDATKKMALSPSPVYSPNVVAHARFPRQRSSPRPPAPCSSASPPPRASPSGGGGGSSSSSGRGGKSSGRGYPDPFPPQKKKQQPAAAPQKLVRTDRTAGSLDTFLRPSRPSFSSSSGSSGALAGSRSSGGGVKTNRGRARGSLAENGEGAGGGLGGEEEEEEKGEGGRRGEGRKAGATEVSSEEEEDEEAIMCVCPEDQEEEEEEAEEEEEEGVEEENEKEDGKREEEGSSGVGEDDEGLLKGALKSMSTDADAEQGGSEQPSLEKIGAGILPPKRTGEGKGKRAKHRRGGKKKESKPFAGIGKHKSCDCCGGRRPRGPGGSIVLTDAAAPTTTGSPGDTDDGVPTSPGTPSEAAMRAQQHKRPATFVDTDCRYHSVRSLIGDFKTQVGISFFVFVWGEGKTARSA